MIRFPKSTVFNKRIPKQKFYENLHISADVKRIFVEQIFAIYWRSKISAETVNITKGDMVTEIEVFEIRLNQQGFDTEALHLIDKEIPYHILFLLEYEGQYQACIGYKEANFSKPNTFKVNGYYNTEWMPIEKLNLKIEGLTTDAVYENFVRQIAGEKLQFVNSGTTATTKTKTLKEAVEQDGKRKRLQKQIESLEKQARSEKQPKKKFELVQRAHELKIDLEDCSHA